MKIGLFARGAKVVFLRQKNDRSDVYRANFPNTIKELYSRKMDINDYLQI